MKIENIKFKAKRLDGKGWVEGNLRTSKSGNAMIIPIENSGAYPVEPTTVCQFTGLKDCDGNDLFEHDLIHFVGHKPIGEVIWSEDDYAFMVASGNEPLYLLSDVIDIGKIKIIGNKFDKEGGKV